MQETATMKDRREDHRKRNCAFCNMVDNENEIKTRKLKLDDRFEKTCFAILAREPNVVGHSLIISTKPFDDITDHIGTCDDEKKKIFEAVLELAEKIKKKLGAEKVYVKSVCEHWEMWEASNGQTTEHLHFHLVPRYRGMRTRYMAGDRLLCRDGLRWEDKDLEKIAKIINDP